MKKRLVVFAITLLTAVLLFSACGNNSKKSEKLDVRGLLSNEYEIEYIFNMAGLSVDSSKQLTSTDGGIYYPVQSDKYKSVADLNKLLSDTYVEEKDIASRIGFADANGRPLYLDMEGQLCRSNAPIIDNTAPEVDYDSIEKGKEEKGDDGRQTVSFSFLENGEDGSQYRCTMQAVAGKDGKWRLKTPRMTTPREVIKQGSGEAVADDVREVADAFVAALATGDTATIEKLTAAQGGSYSYLSQVGITAASISETVEELDYEGEYLVTIEVSGGSGAFREGKNDYRMKVGYADYDSIMVVRYLQPVGFAPYNAHPTAQQTNVAASQVTYLMRLVGDVEFASPAQLPTEVVTEYVLWLSEMSDGPKEGGIPLAELQALVKKYFGIDGFDPGKENIFYEASTDSYYLLGRGLPPFNKFVNLISDGNGVAIVDVTVYDLASDPLMLKPVYTIAYTLNNNWNDSYTFVSGIKKS